MMVLSLVISLGFFLMQLSGGSPPTAMSMVHALSPITPTPTFQPQGSDSWRIQRRGNGFSVRNDNSNVTITIELNAQDFGDLSNSINGKQSRGDSRVPHENSVKCASEKLVTDFKIAADSIEPNPMWITTWASFTPTAHRSEFVQKVLDASLKRLDMQANVIVSHSECKKMKLFVAADSICRARLQLQVGTITIKFDVVVIPTGHKAKFVYTGMRGWNMWGNANWTECTTTKKVVNLACDEQDPPMTADSCYD